MQSQGADFQFKNQLRYSSSHNGNQREIKTKQLEARESQGIHSKDNSARAKIITGALRISSSRHTSKSSIAMSSRKG
jgi:hypothetical protein